MCGLVGRWVSVRWYNNILVLVGIGYNNIWVRGLCMCEHEKKYMYGEL